MSTPTGVHVLRNANRNKGLAFPIAERAALGTHGLLPPAESDIARETARAKLQFDKATTPLAKYMLLMNVQVRGWGVHRDCTAFSCASAYGGVSGMPLNETDTLCGDVWPQARDENLFYRLVMENVTEMMPFICENPLVLQCKLILQSDQR